MQLPDEGAPAQHSRPGGLQPLRETREAIDELDPFSDDDDLLDQLVERSRRVRDLVPALVGLSLASSAHEVTYTLVASPAEIAALDGVQYVDDGPCVAAVRAERPVQFDNDDPTNEARWQLFAEASAAAGVRSTLTLPILVEGRVAGSVNLYAAAPRAFEGVHRQIADVFHAWAPGAVRNADLSFSTRQRAVEAPGRLRQAARVEAAVGIVAAARGIDVPAAREALLRAAESAGVDVLRVAEALIAANRRSES